MRFIDKKRGGALATLSAFVASAALVGAGAAWGGVDGEPSSVCRNGTPNETTVPGTSIGFEHGTSPGGETGVTVCYSDTPNGTPSNVAGGFVHARYDQDGDTYGWCVGDPSGDVTANCFSDGYVKTHDPNPASPGGTASAKVIFGNSTVGQTGVEAGVPNTTGGTSTPRNTLSNTCVWVNGSTPPPVASVLGNCDADPLAVQVATGDVKADTTSVCVTSDASGCTRSVPAPYVATGGDSFNSTVDADVAGVPVTQDTGVRCVGVCPTP